MAEVIDLLAQAGDGASPLPAWIGTGVSSAFLSWLWWQERADRKAAEERERAVFKESADRLQSGLAMLDKARQAVEAAHFQHRDR